MGKALLVPEVPGAKAEHQGSEPRHAGRAAGGGRSVFLRPRADKAEPYDRS